VQPLETGVWLLFTIQRNNEQFSFLPPLKENSRPFIDLLAGDSMYRDENVDVPALLEQFRAESREFAKLKTEYHLY
jgi:uncharacterized protein YbbC (DUF1343 family)